MKNQTNEYYFVNVIDHDLIKIGKFCKRVEEKYDLNVLTGINFAETKDGNLLLGLSLKSETSQKEILELAKPFQFKNVHTQEEDWVSLIMISKICVVGDFNSKMILKENENDNE